MKLLKLFCNQSLGAKLAFSNQVLSSACARPELGWIGAPLALRNRPISMFYALLVLLFVTLATGSDAHAQNRDVLGKWSSGASILEISEHNGQLQAVVLALMDPLYVEGEEFGPVGAIRRDDLNPDESKRDEPVLGLQLLQDYQWRSKKWQGKIYDPESGKVYSSQMSVDAKGQLKMRGYIGMPMLGRTVLMQPVSACTEEIQKMLAKVSLTDCKDRKR